MKETKFTCESGKTYVLGYDFSVEVEYYDIFGKDVALSAKPKKMELMAICYAVVRAFNEDAPATMKEFSRELSIKDYYKMSAEVLSHLNAFYYVPEDMDEKGDEEDGEKNA